MLAIANMRLGRWESALSQFERLSQGVRDPEEDAKRIVYHARTLLSLGRRKEAVEMLLNAIHDRWPARWMEVAEQTLRGLGIEESQLEAVVSHNSSRLGR
jgi:hypothetical protein